MKNLTYDEAILGYGTLIQQWIDEGYVPFFGTILFKPMDESFNVMLSQMTADAMKVYAKLVWRVERRPRSKARWHRLPRGLLYPDLPKTLQSNGWRINHGLHFHYLFLMHPEGRVADLERHFQEELSWYLQNIESLQLVTSFPLDTNPANAVRYIMKWWRKGRFGADDVVVLPRPASDFR